MSLALYALFFHFILDHEWMRGLIHKLDEHTRNYDLYALVIYAFLWYIPLIIGISILTFLTLDLLYAYIKNKLTR